MVRQGVLSISKYNGVETAHKTLNRRFSRLITELVYNKANWSWRYRFFGLENLLPGFICTKNFKKRKLQRAKL